jgi:cystathionine gamma-synthase
VAVVERLGLPKGSSALLFTSPDAFKSAKAHALSAHRKEKKLTESDLTFHVVDIHGVRLYVVAFFMTKTPGVIGFWQNPGIGISTRLGEALLAYKDEIQVVPFSGDLTAVPPPTYLPESDAHVQLRERITGLLHRAAIYPAMVQTTPDDVYLYPSGMASIYFTNELLLQRRPGTVVILGAVFHSTFHLAEDALGGMKHFARCDSAGGGVDEFEEYLEAEAKEGRKISYAFVEFPSNPILVSADLKRVRQLVSRQLLSPTSLHVHYTVGQLTGWLISHRRTSTTSPSSSTRPSAASATWTSPPWPTSSSPP